MWFTGINLIPPPHLVPPVWCAALGLASTLVTVVVVLDLILFSYLNWPGPLCHCTTQILVALLSLVTVVGCRVVALLVHSLGTIALSPLVMSLTLSCIVVVALIGSCNLLLSTPGMLTIVVLVLLYLIATITWSVGSLMLVLILFLPAAGLLHFTPECALIVIDS